MNQTKESKQFLIHKMIPSGSAGTVKTGASITYYIE
jgi:hypothetical protein